MIREQKVHNQRKIRDEALVAMIVDIQNTLATNSQKVTQKAILAQMGVDRKSLVHYPNAKALMKHIIAQNKAKAREKRG